MSRYIITFDLDTTTLSQEYHAPNPNNAYANIRTILEKNGFRNIQGSVYLGEENISEAHGTIAIQEITAKYNWFSKSVSNIKFYRIEADLNAQFIVDGIENAKVSFYKQIELLKESLVMAGLDRAAIESVLNKQTFQLPNGDSISMKQIK